MNLQDSPRIQSLDTVPFYRDYLRATAHLESSSEAVRMQHQQGANALCESLLENAVDGVYGLDLNGFVVFVNPAARRLTGWTLEDLRGRTQHSMVHHSHADGSQYHREDCPIYAAFRDGRVHRRDDEVFWRKDGTSFPVAYSSAPLFHEGKPFGAVVVFRDITDEVLRRQWDADRIGCLTASLRGEPAGQVLQTLCDAFAAFQPGFALHLVRGEAAPVCSALRSLPADVLQELTVQPANGGAPILMQIRCMPSMCQAETLVGAVRDAMTVVALAG